MRIFATLFFTFFAFSVFAQPLSIIKVDEWGSTIQPSNYREIATLQDRFIVAAPFDQTVDIFDSALVGAPALVKRLTFNSTVADVFEFDGLLGLVQGRVVSLYSYNESWEINREYRLALDSNVSGLLVSGDSLIVLEGSRRILIVKKNGEGYEIDSSMPLTVSSSTGSFIAHSAAEGDYLYLFYQTINTNNPINIIHKYNLTAGTYEGVYELRDRSIASVVALGEEQLLLSEMNRDTRVSRLAFIDFSSNTPQFVYSRLKENSIGTQLVKRGNFLFAVSNTEFDTFNILSDMTIFLRSRFDIALRFNSPLFPALDAILVGNNVAALQSGGNIVEVILANSDFSDLDFKYMQTGVSTVKNGVEHQGQYYVPRASRIDVLNKTESDRLGIATSIDAQADFLFSVNDQLVVAGRSVTQSFTAQDDGTYLQESSQASIHLGERTATVLNDALYSVEKDNDSVSFPTLFLAKYDVSEPSSLFFEKERLELEGFSENCSELTRGMGEYIVLVNGCRNELYLIDPISLALPSPIKVGNDILADASTTRFFIDVFDDVLFISTAKSLFTFSISSDGLLMPEQTFEYDFNGNSQPPAQLGRAGDFLYAVSSDEMMIYNIATTDNITFVAKQDTFDSDSGFTIDGFEDLTLVFDNNRRDPIQAFTFNFAPEFTGQSFTVQEDNELDISGAFSDPENDAISLAQQTQPNNGALFIDGANAAYTPNANYVGDDSFTISASDTLGNVQEFELNVAVTQVNDAPFFDVLEFQGTEDNSLEAQLSAVDLEQDSLTFELLLPPENGQASVTLDGFLIYNPAENYFGEDTISVSVTDSPGLSSENTILLTIEAVNDAPQLSSQVFSVEEDSILENTLEATDIEEDTLTFNLVQSTQNGILNLNTDGVFSYTPNDNFFGSDTFTLEVSDGSDVSGNIVMQIEVTPLNDAPVLIQQTFSIEEDSTLDARIDATDIEGDALTFNLISTTQDGTLNLNTDGTFSYTPNSNFFGTDAFTLTTSDGSDTSESITMQIDVTAVNDPPTLAQQAFTTQEDSVLTSELIATDIEADDLIFSVTQSTQNGSLTLNEDGTFLYTPQANYFGVDNFSARVSDGQNTSESIVMSITVTAINDAPILLSQQFATLEDTPLNGAISATDEENNTLTFSVIRNSQNGTLSLSTNGTFTYSPQSNFFGTDTFTVLVSDGQVNSAEATMTINVTGVNDAPEITTTSLMVFEDSVLNATLNSTDIENDERVFSIERGPSFGVVTLASSGELQYVPAINFNGTDSIVVRVSDANGASSSATVTINVAPVNDRPVLTTQSLVHDEDTVFNTTLTASDVEGDTVVFSLISTSAPQNSLSLSAEGALTFTPDANFFGETNVTVAITDGFETAESFNLVIQTLAVDDIPIVESQDVSIAFNTSVSGSFPTVDADGETLTYSVLIEPRNGTVTLQENANYTYTPNPGFSGNDSITFEVSDGVSVVEAMVNITVAPAPVVPNPTPEPSPSSSGGGSMPVYALFFLFIFVFNRRIKAKINN